VVVSGEVVTIPAVSAIVGEAAPNGGVPGGVGVRGIRVTPVAVGRGVEVLGKACVPGT
jgi:hypothetical protein